MTAHDMLAQARQGNPQAIAVILNHFTRPKEITTHVTKNENTLKIVFSAHRLPNQSVMTGFVRRSIEQLNIDGIDTVQIVGERIDDDPATWSAELDLAPAISPASVEASLAAAQDASLSDRSHNELDHPEELNSSAAFPNGVSASSLAIATPTTIVSTPAATSELVHQNGQERAIAPVPSSALARSDSTPPTSTENQAFQDLVDSPILRKPEVVVLLLFVLVLILWQTYLSILEGAAPEGSLNGRELARRLSVSYSTISRRKHRDDFSQWSQALDPDGITWVYTEGVFVPQL
jgi:hypothetical protein